MEARREGDRPPEERLEHLREAIRHLHAAGMHERATHLEAMADKMQEEIERRGMRGEPGRAADMDRVIGELRERLEDVLKSNADLSRQVDELRRQANPRRERSLPTPERD